MQFKETLVRLIFLLTPFTVFSQATTYLPQDARENVLLERLEIKAQTDSVLNFSTVKPFSRKQFVGRLAQFDSNTLTKTDQYNYRIALMNSPEWSTQQFSSKTFSLASCGK